MLITNDLLALGIDVPAVTLVINYDLPRLPEPYLHRYTAPPNSSATFIQCSHTHTHTATHDRSGRCGRFGRKGVVINLLTTDDRLGMDEIGQHFGLNVEELPRDVAGLLQ